MPKIRADSLIKHFDLTWDSLATSLEGLLAVKPYDAILLSEIAMVSGVARNTIYNYARDKPALLAAAAEQASEKLLASVAELASGSGTPTERLAAAIKAVLKVFSSDPRRLILMHSLFENVPAFVQARAGTPLTRILGHVADIVAEGVEKGEFRQVTDFALLIELMAGVMLPAIRLVAREPAQEADVEEAVRGFIIGAIADRR